MTEKKSLLPKKGGDLTRYLGLGSEQGSVLARGHRPAAGDTAAHVEDARIQVEEVEARLGRSTRLWEREWASMMLRSVFKSLRPLRDADPRAVELEARALLLRDLLQQKDREEFGGLHAELESGTYDPARFRADLKARPHYEWDAFTERLLAIDEVPDPEARREEDMVHYLASSVDVILHIVDELRPGECFYDLGSGLGKVAILVAWLAGNQVRGVEYEPAYVRLARARAEKMRLSNLEFIQADARSADYGAGDVFYLYDPFRGEILADVLARLEAVARAKAIRILSRGESSKTLAEVAWLTCTKALPGQVSVFVPR